ncbi:hypothetical protein NADFUDRAFT_82076 [Nadsonia fulvescens var. elongata DSM 6958]|uniref:GSKIP domain-containing protein n=1 Tax=Nadsonia fulvescens var. elongata DSM 6958 TaxID=857566 RepID=A0A1E3PQE2_9ASCO|nr:hypothetical protein NADFUDRAFT_82076 [Nadsonia fulvescens var. elongata DSM 6958]
MLFKEVSGETIQIEIRTFIKEYASMVKRVTYEDTPTRLYDADNNRDRKDDSKTPVTTALNVETLEGVFLTIKLSQKGWEITRQDSRSLPTISDKTYNVYETSESLMMDVSPSFMDKWNEHLMISLNGLENFNHDRFAGSGEEDED